MIAAVRELELVLAGDLVAGADAARAQDAALLIEHDGRPEVDDLGLVDLRRVDARVGVVVVEVQLLQRALAGLVADRAVDRVVDAA